MYLTNETYPDLSPSELSQGLYDRTIQPCPHQPMTCTQLKILLQNLMDFDELGPGFKTCHPDSLDRTLSICGIGMANDMTTISIQTGFLNQHTGQYGSKITSLYLCAVCPIQDFCEHGTYCI